MGPSLCPASKGGKWILASPESHSGPGVPSPGPYPAEPLPEELRV